MFVKPVNQQDEIDVQGMQPLHHFLEKIIDKKVNKVALNIFERLVDNLYSSFSASYKQRLDYCISKLDLDLDIDIDKADDDIDSDSSIKDVAKKVHHFMDGAPLYDRTATQRVAIERAEYVDILTGKKISGEDEIMIDGKPVYFFINTNTKMFFGKRFNTKEMFVSDVKECPELVMIYERETSGQLKAWSVDTSQPAKKVVLGGQLIISQTEVLFAREINKSPPPQIVDNFP